MINDNKVELMTILGAVLVAAGHGNMSQASGRLANAFAMLRRIAERRGKVLETKPPRDLPPSSVSELTALVVAAIIRIAKNDLQGGYDRICESTAMLVELGKIRESRRQSRVDAVGRN